jgi:transcriptional regulator NrdR family protein
MGRPYATQHITCPVCGGHTACNGHHVGAGDGSTMHRYRKCKDCGYRFCTIEIDLDMFRNLTGVDDNDDDE